MKNVEKWKKIIGNSIKKNKIKKSFVNCKKYLREAFLCRKHLERDIFIIICIVFISWLVIYSNIPKSEERIPEAQIIQPPVEIKNIPDEEEMIANLQLNTDFGSWDSYQNQWYGFEIKYPSDWQKPITSKILHGSRWEQKYEFRKSSIGEKDPYIGYDVVVYDLKKIKNVEDTDEFSRKNQEEFSDAIDCQRMTGHVLEKEEFSAERIFIPSNDDCYQPTLFYNLIREEYIFNVVPVFKDGAQKEDKNLKSDILENFPEFFSAATTLNLIDIKRVKTVPVAKKPRIKAPIPYVFDVKNGRRVCNKKNDHPSKSGENKKGHMDMECCLDPDEIPNPNCYYDPGKYGKYL